VTGGGGHHRRLWSGEDDLVAGLLTHAEYPVTVLNDDWGAVLLSSGESVFTGERMLHMKSSSVLALRPGFFTSARRDSYSYGLSELDLTTRVLVCPEEECRYQRFLDRTAVSWINNCGTPEELAESFISAVGLARNVAE
jgi:hypothetical protein